jgi:hypothetical protein
MVRKPPATTSKSIKFPRSRLNQTHKNGATPEKNSVFPIATLHGCDFFAPEAWDNGQELQKHNNRS